MTKPKKIILCADDFGQNWAISQGIVQLIQQHRLSATTCMTNLPDWDAHAALLKPYIDQVQIGLHFNLTRGNTLGTLPFQPTASESTNLATLIKLTYLRKLTVAAVKAELNAQLERFEAALGKKPDFIDGHQHIQQLPIIRQALIEVHRASLDQRCYLRLSSNGALKSLRYPASLPKAFTISLMGANRFKKLLRKNHIFFNQTFSGCYNFNKAVNYRQYFLNFIQQIKHQGLIMCHPGLAEDQHDDLLKNSRPLEYQYLASENFIQDCQLHNVVVHNEELK